MEIQAKFKHDISHAEAYEKALEKLVKVNIIILRSMTKVEVLGKDAVTDGLFRYRRDGEDKSGRGRLIKLRLVAEQGRNSEKLLTYYGTTRRECCVPNLHEIRVFVSAFHEKKRPSQNIMWKFDDSSTTMLAEVVRLINRRYPRILLIFDGQAERLSAAVVLQSVWRSCTLRRNLMVRACEVSASSSDAISNVIDTSFFATRSVRRSQAPSSWCVREGRA